MPKERVDSHDHWLFTKDRMLQTGLRKAMTDVKDLRIQTFIQRLKPFKENKEKARPLKTNQELQIL